MIDLDELLSRDQVPVIAVVMAASERGGVGYASALRLAEAGDLLVRPINDGWRVARADLGVCIAALIVARLATLKPGHVNSQRLAAAAENHGAEISAPWSREVA